MSEGLRRIGTREYRHTAGGGIEWRARCELCKWRTEPVATSDLANIAMQAHVENTHGTTLHDFVADGTQP